ncbi:hypothetical protein [Rhodococcus sp. ARC_M6]|uniref:hypothetical protein n=1 Tax=Rhodococcus sp. ARC_M6 TaxID=2928852 RepID=UPI001FB1ACD9|nr:hypothetical protein [Rhodococcus sp. ARC_M6]MCJ0906486.1 hypothetical protein [Rhodococcus sp. ARC_M6]
MGKTITTTRRRVTVAAAGIAAVAAIAVPGIAWANGSVPDTAPAVVSTPAAELVPATQSDECAPALTPEEVDALVAKGELSLEDSTPAVMTEALVGERPDEPGSEGENVASTPPTDSSVTLAISC